MAPIIHQRTDTRKIMDRAPFLISDLDEWFGTLTNYEFDLVCCNAVYELMSDEYLEYGKITVRELRVALFAVRSRYRKMIPQPLCRETPIAAPLSIASSDEQQDQPHPSAAA